jgi:hypothetical protein
MLNRYPLIALAGGSYVYKVICLHVEHTRFFEYKDLITVTVTVWQTRELLEVKSVEPPPYTLFLQKSSITPDQPRPRREFRVLMSQK